MRAGRVLAGGHDGEVHLVVPFGDDPPAEFGRHRRFGAPDQFDLTTLQLTGDLVDRRSGGCQGIDLGLILRHPQRADDVDRPDVVRPGDVREQLDEEPRPHLIPDGDPPGSRRQLADERRRVFGLAPREQVEHARLLDDAGCFEPRDDHRGVAVAGHDQHRQAFERHRRVAGQVGQVMSDREQQRVDVLLGHRRPDTGQAVEIDGRVDGGCAHRPSLPARSPTPPQSPTPATPTARRIPAVTSGRRPRNPRLRQGIGDPVRRFLVTNVDCRRE